MIRECPDLTAVLVHVMLDRARVFRRPAARREDGLARPPRRGPRRTGLNNPASAVARSARCSSPSSRRSTGHEAILCLESPRCPVPPTACASADPGQGSLQPLRKADRREAIERGFGSRHRRRGRRGAGRGRLQPPDVEASPRWLVLTGCRPCSYVSSGSIVRQLASEIGSRGVHSSSPPSRGFVREPAGDAPADRDRPRGSPTR
jgi:hypothetical protein